MPAGDVLPPEAYHWWVPVVGVLLLLGVALWYWFVHRLTRPRPAPAPEMPAGLRRRYEEAVEAEYARYRDGEHDLRVLHLELARTMREFASERIGTDVRAWTRREVSGYDPTRRVGSLLATWEEPSFARRSDAEAATSAARAREVIRLW